MAGGPPEEGKKRSTDGIRASERTAPKEFLVTVIIALELAGLALSTTGRVIRILKS